MQDIQSTNAPMDKDTYTVLHEGLLTTFKDAVAYANSPYSKEKAEHQRAVAELAQALILLESRAPR